MLECLNKKGCELKDILDVLCDSKNYVCKEGNFMEIRKFINKNNGKSIIFFVKGNVDMKKAKTYALMIQEMSKAKKVIWAVKKSNKLSFKVLITS